MGGRPDPIRCFLASDGLVPYGSDDLEPLGGGSGDSCFALGLLSGIIERSLIPPKVPALILTAFHGWSSFQQ